MNKKFTNIEEHNNILEKYPIENILSLLKDTLGENILVRDIVAINNNIMLEVTNLDETNDYFIKMMPYEEQEVINRIDIIVANPDKTYFIRYVYNYTNDNFVICKVKEKYKKGNVWITKNAFGIKVENENNLQEQKVKVKTRQLYKTGG